MVKPDFLVYSNDQITQIVGLMNQLNITGLQNVKIIANIAYVLENPVKTEKIEEEE
jgi:hypothetical protein